MLGVVNGIALLNVDVSVSFSGVAAMNAGSANQGSIPWQCCA
jgi:hypothetical protein